MFADGSLAGGGLSGFLSTWDCLLNRSLGRVLASVMIAEVRDIIVRLAGPRNQVAPVSKFEMKVLAASVFWILGTSNNLLGQDTPWDAVQVAAQDCATLASQGLDVSGVRYIWVQSGSKERAALVSYALNAVVSRSDINHPPFVGRSPLQRVSEKMLRVDLVGFSPRAADLEETKSAWEKIRNPRFRIENKISAALAVDGDVGETKVFGGVLHRIEKSAEPFVQNGKTYDKRWVPVADLEAESLIFGPHVDAQEAASLALLTGSSNPVVWCVSFLESALTQADGGLYYEFVGIKKSTEEGVSDQEALLKSLGVSSELLTELRAEQRVGLVTSNVTGKTRRIDMFSAPSRASVCQGLIVVTQDVFDDYEAAQDVFLNLLNFKVDGTEGMFERKNGHLAWWLADGNGNLVDEAPPNLVSDHKIPAPYTRRLQPGISCIRCHSGQADGGWKPFTNEVRDLLSQFEILDDIEGSGPSETRARLLELYYGSMDKPLRRAREDQSDVVVVASGSEVTTEDGLPWQFYDVGRALEQLWVDQFYSPVTTERALVELGYPIGDDPVVTFRELMGVRSDGTEDVRIAFLKIGKPINPEQWEQVFADASLRALQSSADSVVEE